MTSTASIDTRAPRQRTLLGMLSIALVAATACAGFAVLSGSTAHRAGAATVRPHALDGPVTMSMSVAGVVGEGGSGGAGSIEVNSFQWGVKVAASNGSGGGAGKAHFAEFTITKMVDSASPNFFRNCVAGAHYKSVILAVRKAGTPASEYMTFTLGTVLVASVSWSGSATSGMPPTETIAFDAHTYKLAYTRPLPGA